jgi:WD40 repeat protein
MQDSNNCSSQTNLPIRCSLIFFILLEKRALSVSDLVVCFRVCRSWKQLLEVEMGFCFTCALVCTSLIDADKKDRLLSEIRQKYHRVSTHSLGKIGQLLRFLEKYQNLSEWTCDLCLQLFSQEPDGSFLCEGARKMCWIFDGYLITQVGKTQKYHPCMLTIKGHAPSNRLCQCCFDKTGLLKSRKRDCPVRGHAAVVLCASFSVTGLLASGSSDKMVKIWDVSGLEPNHVHSWQGHTNSVRNRLVVSLGKPSCFNLT